MIDNVLLGKILARHKEARRVLRARIRHSKEEQKLALAEIQLVLEEMLAEGIDVTTQDGWAIALEYLEQKNRIPARSYEDEFKEMLF